MLLLQTNSSPLSFQLMSPCVLPARPNAPQHNMLSARELRRKSNHRRNENEYDDVSGRRSFPQTHWLEDASSAREMWGVRKRDDKLPTRVRHERYPSPPPGAACVQLARRPLVCSPPAARRASRRSAVPRQFPASRRFNYVQTGLRFAYSVALSSQ